MQSRRDLVQAQAYLNGRLVSALLTADPDAAETPTRRTTMGVLIGIGLLLLAVGGVAGFALIFGGSSDEWRKPGVLVVDKDTGSRYVFVADTLHPVLNLASAKLLLGPSMPIVRVGHDSLEGVPHGRAVGISGAPEALPEPGRRTDRWQVCGITSTDPGRRDRPAVTVEAGMRSSVDLADSRELGDDEAVWVTGPDGARYLLWRGRRLRVPSPTIANVLGYTRSGARDVGAGLLNAVPAGPDLVAIDVPGRGEAGRDLDGRPTRIGQVFVVRTLGADDRHLLQLAGSMVALSTLDAQLVLADSATRDAYAGDGDGEVRALPLSAAAAAATTPVEPPGRAGLPTTVPRIVSEPGTNPCVVLDIRADGVDVSIELDRTSGGQPPALEPAVATGPLTADRIAVTPAGGALVRTLVAPGVTGATSYLITDLGVKYPVTPDAAEALGFDEQARLAVFAGVLDLLPTGPTLTTAGAEE